MNIIAQAVRRETADLRDRFVSATPFHHVIIDGFFEAAFVAELVAQFPAFERRYAINELGRVGGKAVRPALWELGPAYKQAHDFFASREFLDWSSEITGIPGLQYDQENFGGGTHENIEGQELTPHVDFNYHPRTHYHRRLNLIVYLNEGWQAQWGGNITVHSNPRDPVNDQVKAYAPVLNRCIIFETSERSWHSFDRISLPPERKNDSRKSLSIYLYTRERPDEETYSPHTTFYVPRPLPAQFQAGRTLTDDDVNVLQGMLTQRDELIGLHQSRESQREPATLEANRYLIRLNELALQARLPLLGYVRQEPGATGWYGDGWTDRAVQFAIVPARRVSGFTIEGRFPDRIPPRTKVNVEVDGAPICEADAQPGPFVLACGAVIGAGRPATVRISISATVNYKALGLSEDARDLGIFVESITFDH